MRGSARFKPFVFAAVAGFLATAAVAETRSMTISDGIAASQTPGESAGASGDPTAIAPSVEAVVAPRPAEQPVSLAVAAPTASGLMGFLARIVQSAGDHR